MEGRAPASPAFLRISRRSLGVAELRPPDAAITGESGCGLARVAVQAFPSFFVIRHSDFVILVIRIIREPSRRDRRDRRQSREGTRRATGDERVSNPWLFRIFPELRFGNSGEE